MTDPMTPPTQPGQLWPTAPTYSQPGEAVQTGLAVATLVLGILGLTMCPLVGVVALVMGIVCLVRIRNEPHRHGGRGMAIAGLTCGAVSLVWLPVLLAIVLASLSRARELSKRMACAANMKAIGTTLMIYSHDHSDQGPLTLDMLVEMGLVDAKQIVCPSANPASPNYIFVAGSADAEGGDSESVVMYEPKANHGGEGGNFLFTDGHASFERGDRYDELVERPRAAAPE